MVGFEESDLRKLFKAVHFLFLFLCSGVGFAQLSEYMVMGTSGNFQPAPYTQPYDIRYQGVEGTPMLFDSWTKCNVYNDSFLFLEEVLVNYDLLNKHLLILDAKKKVYLLQSPFYTSILDFQGRSFWLKPEDLEWFEEDDSGALEALGNTNRLYAFRKKRFLQADFKGGYSAGRTSDQYIEENEYFLREKNGTDFKKIKLSSGSLRKALSEDEWQRAEKVIQANNLRVDSEMAMIFVMQRISE